MKDLPFLFRLIKSEKGDPPRHGKMKKKTEIDLIKSDSSQEQPPSPPVKRETERPPPDLPPEKPKAGRIKKSFLIFGMAGLILMGGSVGMALKLGWISIPGLSQAKKTESPRPDERGVGPIVKLSPLVVNLKEESGRHYLKTTIILEFREKDRVETVQSSMSLLTDIAILILSEKRVEELRNLEVKEHLKQELLEKMNQHLDPGKIKRIYFDEFLYQ